MRCYEKIWRKRYSREYQRKKMYAVYSELLARTRWRQMKKKIWWCRPHDLSSWHIMNMKTTYTLHGIFRSEVRLFVSDLLESWNLIVHYLVFLVCEIHGPEDLPTLIDTALHERHLQAHNGSVSFHALILIRRCWVLKACTFCENKFLFGGVMREAKAVIAISSVLEECNLFRHLLFGA